MYRNFFKRLIDIVLSSLAVVVLALPMLMISLAIVIDDPGPVVFTQKRVGKNKNGEHTYFSMYKFRTMKMDAPHNVPTHLLKNPEQYITSVGRFLRKTSGDELMQIFNIFAGEMSIIGPRPALWNQYDLIHARDKYGANDVRPGLSGWAQVNGRDTIEIEDKARFDGEYASHMSLRFDCKCFMKTIMVVLTRKDIVEGKESRENEIIPQ